MQTIDFKASGTFAYAGTVTDLDPATAWGAACAVQNVNTKAQIGDLLEVTLTKAPDWATSGNWLIAIFAGAAVTATWLTASKNTRGLLQFDIKFFDTANPDPVLRTDTVQIDLEAPITP